MDISCATNNYVMIILVFIRPSFCDSFIWKLHSLQNEANLYACPV